MPKIDQSLVTSSKSRLMGKNKAELKAIARANCAEYAKTDSKEDLVKVIQEAQAKWVAKNGRLYNGEY